MYNRTQNVSRDALYELTKSEPRRAWSGEGRNRNKWLSGLDPATWSVEIEAFYVHSAESMLWS
jgi:hypothetical protein